MFGRRRGEESWEESHRWYDALVGKRGHYYHRELIIPNSLRLLKLGRGDSLLDLCCGQGVVSRYLPPGVDYLGVDAAPSLIERARSYSSHRFLVADIGEPLSLDHPPFSHAIVLLALQNLESFQPLFANLFRLLRSGGRVLIVLNHPCFRIPRQSSWGVDRSAHLSYRRVDRYMSPMSIPIQTSPSKQAASSTTYSFHQPLSAYVQGLSEANFKIVNLEEWTSNKKSVGAAAQQENRCRQEFPLFLALLAARD